MQLWSSSCRWENILQQYSYSNQKALRKKQQQQSGRYRGESMQIAQCLLAIVRNKQYWLHLGNESNTITKFFDTWFACDGTLQTYVDNVLDCPSITLFYVFFCLFWVPYYESKVPAGSISTNLGPLDRIYFSIITLKYLKA